MTMTMDYALSPSRKKRRGLKMSIRKPLSLLITLALVCGLVPTPALAEVMDDIGEVVPLEAAPAQDDEGTEATEPEDEAAAPDDTAVVEDEQVAEDSEDAAHPEPDTDVDSEPAEDLDDAGPARADV